MVIRRGNQNINKVALTFDDGPNPIYTEKILSTLKEAGVAATFFLMGHNAEQYPDIVRNIQADGHDIGNHTYSHIRLDDVSEDVIANEITKASSVIAKITGKSPEFFRPPGGNIDKEHMVENIASTSGLRTVLWNLQCSDWRWPWETQHYNKLVIWGKAGRIYKRVAQNAKPGSIIDLHDGGNHQASETWRNTRFRLIVPFREYLEYLNT